MGLEPNGREAHLVPYRNKRGETICTLIVSFSGKRELVMRTDMFVDVWTTVVREKDTFNITEGYEQRIEHVPAATTDRGKVIGCYAVAKFKSGHFRHDYIELADIERIRRKSKAADDGPWVTDFDEMCRKTALHRLCKNLPQSRELSVGLEADTRADMGLPPTRDLGPSVDILPEPDPEPMTELVAPDKTESRTSQLTQQLSASVTSVNSAPPVTVNIDDPAGDDIAKRRADILGKLAGMDPTQLQDFRTLSGVWDAASAMMIDDPVRLSEILAAATHVLAKKPKPASAAAQRKQEGRQPT
jgi:recombinational DNA repair protein RecT